MSHINKPQTGEFPSIKTEIEYSPMTNQIRLMVRMNLYLYFVSIMVITASRGSSIDQFNIEDTKFPLGRASDITYHFYSQRHPSHSIKIRSSTSQRLNDTDFCAEKPSLFIIHGWKNHNESEVNYKIRETILGQQDINVFVVDWSPIAGKNYVSAKRAVVRVGQYVANFIVDLKRKFGLILEEVKFVGHSLGAHICGNAGAALGGRVDRIVGLDPAGPFFTVRNKNNRLDESDAKFVQVIHTNGGLLGFGEPMGHADYYPNGGSTQSGCGIDLLGTCAHSRAYAYYAESLRSAGFVAKKCGSYWSYKRGRCNGNEESAMGGFVSDYSARGSYYLKTNSHSPFAKR